MVSLTVCMMIKNEEMFLAETLMSVADIADQIVIVDTGSVDKSKEIAAEFEAEIIDFKWVDDASAARNAGLARAKGDWIFVIDGDEILDEESKIQITNCINSENVWGFTIIQRNYTKKTTSAGFVSSSEYGFPGYYDNRILRLFRNHESVRFRSAVHERIEESIFDLGHKTEDSSIVLHHLREKKNIEEKKQVDYYLRLYEEKLKVEPEDWDTHLGIGIIAHTFLKDPVRAEFHLKRALQLQPSLLKAAINLSYLYLEGGRLNDANKLLVACLRKHPENTTLLNNLASVYLRAGKLLESEQITKKVLSLDSDNISGLLNQGVIFVGQKKLAEAVATFSRVISLDAESVEAHMNRALTYNRLHEHGSAKDDLRRVLQIDPHNERAKKALEQIT